MAYSITSSDEGCYPNTTVLINRLNLKSQEALDEAERISVTVRTAQALQQRYEEPFTFSFYCGLHKRLFGDIYDWAGQLRTVDISKKGTNFYPASELQHMGEAKFQWLQSEHEFRNQSFEKFAYSIADFYHEINMLHPFREGNGRTQRLFFTLLIQRAGYHINFAACDMELLMLGTIHAAHGIMDYLNRFFLESITES